MQGMNKHTKSCKIVNIVNNYVDMLEIYIYIYIYKRPMMEIYLYFGKSVRGAQEDDTRTKCGITRGWWPSLA